MAERHDINITISDTGDVQITVNGINGPKCIDATDFLESDIGEVISQEKTSEYYKQDNKIDEKIQTQ